MAEPYICIARNAKPKRSRLRMNNQAVVGRLSDVYDTKACYETIARPGPQAITHRQERQAARGPDRLALTARLGAVWKSIEESFLDQLLHARPEGVHETIRHRYESIEHALPLGCIVE